MRQRNAGVCVHSQSGDDCCPRVAVTGDGVSVPVGQLWRVVNLLDANGIPLFTLHKLVEIAQRLKERAQRDSDRGKRTVSIDGRVIVPPHAFPCVSRVCCV